MVDLWVLAREVASLVDEDFQQVIKELILKDKNSFTYTWVRHLPSLYRGAFNSITYSSKLTVVNLL